MTLICLSCAIICHANTADLNTDGKVNFTDISILAHAWRTQIGDPNWDPNCDISEPNDLIINERDLAVMAHNWLWTQIVLDVYSDGWGDLLDTIILQQQGPTSFIIEEDNPYYDPPDYYAYAAQQGYSTEIYCFTGTEVPHLPLQPRRFLCDVNVDLDQTICGKFNGTMFLTQAFFADSYLADTDVNVIDPNTLVLITQFHTDSQGRFTLAALPHGSYFFEFYEEPEHEEYYYHFEEVLIQKNYQDFCIPANDMVWKPNIYLYPQQTSELDVDIAFPHGGRVTTAIPDFNNPWHITVEPSGIINGQYEYLFYESVQPDYAQYSAGWVISRENLGTFFRTNMAQTGFNQKEIDDFVEYWIPRLINYQYYAIYPQYNDQLDNMIKLDFSVQPQSIIRLIYAIRGLQTDSFSLPEPQIPPFTRDGFTVVEWGVTLK